MANIANWSQSTNDVMVEKKAIYTRYVYQDERTGIDGRRKRKHTQRMCVSVEKETHGFAKRHIITRLATAGCVPLELLSSLQNLIKLCFLPFGIMLKYPLKGALLCVKSESLKI